MYSFRQGFMFRILIRLIFILFGLLVLSADPSRAQTAADEKSRFLFASVEDGIRILASKDEYIAAMSPLDRSVRMKTDREVSPDEFVAFIGRQVLAWKGEEKARIESVLWEIRGGLERASVPGLGTVTLIKTTGEEEGNAAYTRGQSVVLPKSTVQGRTIFLKRLLAHELFHILSRSSPAVRDALYKTIGFRYCGQLEFPRALVPRRLTNPDAPKNDYCIRVKVNGEPAWATPILLSNTAKYAAGSNKGLFDYMQSALLVRRAGSGGQDRPVEAEGVRLVGANEVSDFFDQVGRNTDYITHPEEILADNFALLVLGEKNVPSPEILSRIRSTLVGLRLHDH